MPASITTDFVVSSPKVAGRRMLIPESGPMPGSTPTMVPTKQPRNAYHNTSGCSATEKPSRRLSSVGISEPEQAGFDRGLEHYCKQQVSEHDDADAEGGGAQQWPVLDRKHQREQQQRHGDQKAGDLIDENCGSRDCRYS